LSDSDLLVLAPWAVFIAGLAVLIMATVTRSHGSGHHGRRRGRFRRRQRPARRDSPFLPEKDIRPERRPIAGITEQRTGQD